MTKTLWIGLFVLAACGKGKDTGACEWTWLESSADGSIEKGTENCAPDWIESKCTIDGTGASAANVPAGKFVFSAGKSCQDRGYQPCDKSRNIDFRKSCPAK